MGFSRCAAVALQCERDYGTTNTGAGAAGTKDYQERRSTAEQPEGSKELGPVRSAMSDLPLQWVQSWGDGTIALYCCWWQATSQRTGAREADDFGQLRDHRRRYGNKLVRESERYRRLAYRWHPSHRAFQRLGDKVVYSEGAGQADAHESHSTAEPA